MWLFGQWFCICFYIKLRSILTVLCVFLIFSLVEEHPCMKHYWRSWDGVLFHLIWIPVRFTSTQAKTWSYKNLLCDTHVSNFSSLDVIGISILHQVWSWASGLMSQMVSRRQPIYRLVCMVDVTSSASAVHQSPATQHRLTSASQHSVCPASLWLSISSCTLSFQSYNAFSLLFKSCWCSTISLDKKPNHRLLSEDVVQPAFERRSLSDKYYLNYSVCN